MRINTVANPCTGSRNKGLTSMPAYRVDRQGICGTSTNLEAKGPNPA
jgi:hypothetical protein